MDRQKIINGLEFTKAMITLDPSTGKYIDPGSLNELDKTTYDACVGAIAMLKEQEAVEPKTGHWIEYEGTQGNYYDCSVCDCSLMEIHRGMKYCPYCGAKMDNPM